MTNERHIKQEHPTKKFGEVFKGIVYRGSWPDKNSIKPLLDFGIKNIVTLFSSKDQKEILKIKELKETIGNTGVNHILVDLSNLEVYFTAAEKITKLETPTYIHCFSGANRTGIVILLAKLIKENGEHGYVSKEDLTGFITEAIDYGFDFDKLKYRLLLEETLDLAKEKGLIKD